MSKLSTLFENNSKSNNKKIENNFFNQSININTNKIKHSNHQNYNTYNKNQDDLSFKEKMNQIDYELRQKWEFEQIKLSNQRLNSNPDKDFYKKIKYVGGLDISFSKTNDKVGFVGLVVLDFYSFEVVYEKYEKVVLNQPYYPSFLAFREVDHYVKILNDLKNSDKKNYFPDVVLLDGNGIMHPKECGIAVHLGVLLNVPTIGCAKTVYAIDGINSDYLLKLKNNFQKSGQYTKLKGKEGKIWGAAVITYFDEEYSHNNYYSEENNFDSPNDPIIVSEGNLIDLNTAIDVVIKFNKVNRERVPFPIYLADKNTRKMKFKFDNENKYK